MGILRLRNLVLDSRLLSKFDRNLTITSWFGSVDNVKTIRAEDFG